MMTNEELMALEADWDKPKIIEHMIACGWEQGSNGVVSHPNTSKEFRSFGDALWKCVEVAFG